MKRFWNNLQDLKDFFRGIYVIILCILFLIGLISFTSDGEIDSPQIYFIYLCRYVVFYTATLCITAIGRAIRLSKEFFNQSDD